MIATTPIRNWQPIVQALESIVGQNGIISSREERSVYECDGLASYRELPGLVVAGGHRPPQTRRDDRTGVGGAGRFVGARLL